MKGPTKTKLILRNIAIVLLGIGAVAYLSYQIYYKSPLSSHYRPTVATNPAPAPVTTPAPAKPTATNAPPALASVLKLDRHYAESHLAGWMASPLRDPFLLIKPVAPPAHTNQVSNLTLKAIWRQDGVSMVVINHGIYRLGDTLGDAQIVNIENQGVWLEDNGKKEFVSFPGPASANRFNPAEAPPEHLGNMPQRPSPTPEHPGLPPISEAPPGETSGAVPE
jgi:type II secretory pathway component PulC